MILKTINDFLKGKRKIRILQEKQNLEWFCYVNIFGVGLQLVISLIEDFLK